MWMPPLTTVPPLAEALQGRGDQGPYRGKDDGRVQFLRRQFVGVAGPDGPQLRANSWVSGIPRAGEGIDLLPWCTATWT